MLFIHEKRKKNSFVILFCVIGFFVMLLIACGMWIAVMVMIGAVNYFILAPVAFTVFFCYVSGVLIRGLEKHSIGLDLDEMDYDEIDFTIMTLEKQKREYDKVIPVDMEKRRAKK